MCKYSFIILMFFSLSFSMTFSQNLVPNPGFEENTACPEDMNYDWRSFPVSDWYLPTRGTPDYFHACNRFNVGVPINVMGSCLAAEGVAYTGIVLLEKPDYLNHERKKPYEYREYLQAELIAPLIRDSLYKVSMAYTVADYSMYAVNRLGIQLSVKKIRSGKMNPLILRPDVMIDTSIIKASSGVWYLLCDTIRASGGEIYITIGNFFSDANTQYITRNQADTPPFRRERIIAEGLAYYFVDMIEIRMISGSDRTNK
jgi:OmpA-OmpF porin, OOP family